jgi:cell division protein FtsW
MRKLPSFLSPRSAPSAPAVQGWEGAAIVSIVLILLSIGLSTLYSASSYLSMSEGGGNYVFLLRQLQGAILGGALLFIVSQLDYRRWWRMAWPLLTVVTLMLVIVILPGTHAIAPEINGARRWLRLPGMTIQPSEFAKLALVIWTARMVLVKAERLQSLRHGLLPILCVWGLVIGLIALEPAMSAAGLSLILAFTVAFVGGARIAHFAFLGAIAAVPAWIAIMAAPYRVRRITAFMDPLAHESGASYQIVQSLTAIGSGGIFGRGFGQSKLKDGFLPEPHNDFASSVLGEEWGLVGMTVLVLLYLLIMALAHRIATRAPDAFGSLLAYGAGAFITIPAILHLAINLSMIPPTGVALPFVSFGRSNLLASFVAIGLLLSVAAAGVHRREVIERLRSDGSSRPHPL